MGQRDAIPYDQIRSPTFKQFDAGAMVERLDPERHRPQPEYDFNNGRKFMKEHQQIYADSLPKLYPSNVRFPSKTLHPEG